MVKIHKVEPNSPEWFELRAEYDYTASNAYELLRTGTVKKNDGFTGNKYTRRGHDLEPVALELFHKLYGTESIEHGFVTNSKYPRAGASPDDLTDEFYIEVKSFGKDRHLSCAKDIFVEVMAQIQFGMLITEYTRAKLVLFNPDLKPKDALFIREIKADNAIQNNIKRKLLG